MLRGVETAREATPAMKPRRISSRSVGLCGLRGLDTVDACEKSMRRIAGRVTFPKIPSVERERRKE